MGVYESFLKKNKLKEDEEGKIIQDEEAIKRESEKEVHYSMPTSMQKVLEFAQNAQKSNSVANRVSTILNGIDPTVPNTNRLWNQVLDRVTQNISTFKNSGNNPDNSINSIRNVSSAGSERLKANNNSNNTNSFFGKMNDLENGNKFLKSLNGIQENSKINLPINNQNNEKNNNVFQDLGSLAKLTGLGIKTGAENTTNMIETANEQLHGNYKDLKERQYLYSPKTSVYDKAMIKLNGYKKDKGIETNLVKKSIRDNIAKDEEEIQKEQSKLSNDITKSLGDVAPSMGQMLPGTALSAINPVLGTGYFYTSSGGSYINDGLQRGMTEEQAWKYGNIMATLESASETVITGQQLNKVTKAFSGKQISKSVLNSYGFNVFENAIQEAVMEPAQELTAQIVAGNDKADWSNMGQRMFEAGFNGGLMGVISNGATYGLEKTGKAYNKIKNGQSLTEAEVKGVLQENVDTFGQESVENSFKQGANAVYQQINPTTMEIKQVNLPTRQLNNQEQKNVSNQNMATNEQQNNLKGKSFEDIVDEAMSNYENDEVKSPLQNRDIKTIGKEKINAYQYDNPEVKPYFQQMAQMIGEDVGNISSQDNRKTVKGGGTMLNTNISAIKQLKEMGYSYNQIIDGIVDIIDDHGKENNALSKKLEIIIDDQLRNGYTNSYGKYISPNQEYINLINNSNQNVVANNQEINNFSGYTQKEINNINSIPQNNEVVKNDTITNNYAQTIKNDTKNKTLNPAEISNLKEEKASTTPILPTKNYTTGNKQSSFFSNIVTDAKFLNEDLRQEMAKDENIRYYNGVTNAKTLEKAYQSLQDDGENGTINWFNKDTKNNTAEDVAKGWILLKQYQDKGDYESAVEVAKKMRNMGSNAGQTVQAYNILSRLTPEGMFYYAQSELSEAYNKMVEGKTKKWIEENANKFDLTPAETKTIMDIMKEVATMEEGREKQIKLAEIQKLVQDKIPPTIGQSIKAWMRNSMLLNPKTLHRNILGNAVMVPINVTSDVFSTGVDKIISKRTGVRTTGITKEGTKGYIKGFGKGLYESYDDFRRGINTRDMDGNKFEIGEGKSFKDKGLGKALNRIDNFLNFALDAGDRPFYEASFVNSINNQLVLNNTKEVTQDMIEIASTEALQRTWQDSNAYTSAVLTIRNILNGKIDFAGIHTKGLNYGLGDVLIPFAKTPANLTKAIVDYSPVGLTKTLAVDARKFNNSLKNGQYSPQLQHKFVQSLGKGMAGSLLYVLGYGLAKAGIATGESDDDKDIKNFMKNSMGVSSYSIKIGDKTFTYDWAQPIAVPLSIMTNYVKYSKDNPDASAIDKAIKSMNIGTEQLLEQSFMQSLNTVLNGNGTTLENLSKAVLDLPSRAIPTFSKQIADMVDDTQRTTFEYEKPVQSAINSMIAKIPFASKTLPASTDTLGNEVKKYGGDNNWWNVFFNPANVNKGQLSKVGQEIYNTYMQTGDTTIFPRVAPYYINNKGKKITITAEQRNQFQKISGQYVESTVNDLLNNNAYKKLNDEQKAKIISEVVSDSYSKAKYDVLKLDTDEYKKVREILKDVKPSSYYDYKNRAAKIKKENDKIDVLLNSNYTNKERQALYENYIKSNNSDGIDLYTVLMKNGLNINQYLKYKQQDFESDKIDDGTVKGKSVNTKDEGSKRSKMFSWVNENIGGYTNRLLILGSQYKLDKKYRDIIEETIYNLDLSSEEKLQLLGKMQGFTVYKNGDVKW